MRTGSRNIIANCSFPINAVDPADRILHNPSKEELQAHFDTVDWNHGPEKGRGEPILRGVISQDGKDHSWGSAVKYTHTDLKKERDLGWNVSHLMIHADGRIKTVSNRPMNVPGIGLTVNAIGAVSPGTPPQQGYDQWRNEIGSGQNQYPTGDQASPTEPQPLDEWEADAAPRTGDSPQKAIPSGWEDKRGGKGQQRPGKRPASRYQQPFGDQDVGQGRGDREEKNYGPLEF